MSQVTQEGVGFELGPSDFAAPALSSRPQTGLRPRARQVEGRRLAPEPSGRTVNSWGRSPPSSCCLFIWLGLGIWRRDPFNEEVYAFNSLSLSKPVIQQDLGAVNNSVWLRDFHCSVAAGSVPTGPTPGSTHPAGAPPSWGPLSAAPTLLLLSIPPTQASRYEL